MVSGNGREYESFTLLKLPSPGSEEVLINGLLEHGSDVYTVHGSTVTLTTPVSHTDQITIKYRYHRWPFANFP